MKDNDFYTNHIMMMIQCVSTYTCALENVLVSYSLFTSKEVPGSKLFIKPLSVSETVGLI